MKESDELLRAVYQLLSKQDKTPYVINIHSQTVNLDADCELDGMSLQEHIKDYLENNDIDPYLFDSDSVEV